uniref:Cullin-associated NEDD8-dissociated protein 1-like n=1 Tax=Sinocyclocheilus rhinocerous TaxID=307959 RepID=A0A673HFK6_9TELE
MASASYHISNLLEKMTSSDKDFRFMATNDLMSELQKDSIKLDDDSERKVVKMILKLLEDKNGEVQNLAVKCLGPLVSKVKEYQVETIVDTLCTNMLSDKEQLRDISSIGLKTVIGELPPASSGSALAASVCKKITGRLTSAIAKQEDVSVQLEALDIMADMLSSSMKEHFSSFRCHHSNLQKVPLVELSTPGVVILCNHQPQVFHPHVQAIVPPVVACVGDPFYKITSEALLVTQQLVKVIRPLDQTDAFDASPYIADLFACTIKRLKAADIDQEVKERAISCTGQIICNLGDSLGADLPGTLLIFLERLKNEITRLTTVKALTLIAGSPLKINLRPILGEAVPILASFLRKNQRALKLSTLAALDILVKNYSDSVTPAMIDAVLAELPPLINESDMHVSQMAISFLTTLARVHPDSLSKISGSILAELIALVRSPLLQGGALSAMLEFFQALVATGTASLGYMDLLRMLTGPVYAQSAALTHKQSYYSIAKCVAALTRACPKEGPAVVGQFIQDVKNSRSTDSIRLLALLSLGEVGHHVDLSGQPELKTVILDAFSSASEEVKSAASYALGSISVGNLPEYLPFVLQEISGQPKRQYLLLHSLKEIISSASVAGLKPYVENVWALLLKHCECTEEGTRNVVAECLGKLTLIDPETLLPRLKGYLLSGSSYARSSVVTAVKFTISDHPQTIDPLLKNCIGDFLKTLEDPDLNVRRVALVTFNSAAHNKPSLIRDLLDTVLPHLYNETKVRKDLIREVEMGPFKHTVDDGLDIRKAAFECMYTLLDSCLDRLDIFEFLNHVEDGLKDHYDIKMLTFLMLARLSSLCPSAVLQRLDRLVEPLRATCTTKVKANSVKQEFEKQDELKRSAMRAVVALLTIPEAEKSPLMSEFQSQISSNPELAAIFDSIQRDSSSANMESMDTS